MKRKIDRITALLLKGCTVLQISERLSIPPEEALTLSVNILSGHPNSPYRPAKAKESTTGIKSYRMSKAEIEERYGKVGFLAVRPPTPLTRGWGNGI